MNIPCVKKVFYIVSGLAFLQPALTRIQFDNLTLVASALVLGSSFNLSAISFMWLKTKCVSTLSYFFNDTMLNLSNLQNLYAKNILSNYNLEGGSFIIDDTMQHHTNLCKCIHGVCVMFDHALKTNLKAVCIVVLYYSDGNLIKFPINFRIYYKEKGARMPWQRGREIPYRTKYELALDMIKWALDAGFPRGIVLADSWYGIAPFLKGLKKLDLSYVIEIKTNYTIKVPCREPKLTPKGKLSKNQTDKLSLPQYFESLSSVVKCGFANDIETGKKEKVLYHTKTDTVNLSSLGKHRVLESIDPIKKTTKYLVTNELTWEAVKIISVYSGRWVIEEFFRNAKQLLDMEGAIVRSEQGVTLALCLVSWIDFLLHHENYKRSTVKGLPKESLTIPSIIRQAQYENLEAFIEKIKDESFVKRWFKLEEEKINRKRKKRKELVEINQQPNGVNF